MEAGAQQQDAAEQKPRLQGSDRSAGAAASAAENGPLSGADSSGDDAADWPDGGAAAQEGTYRKRGRPRKYEGLDEAERRKRRMADNRQSAKRYASLTFHALTSLPATVHAAVDLS